jgi:hypothetical protein
MIALIQGAAKAPNQGDGTGLCHGFGIAGFNHRSSLVKDSTALREVNRPWLTNPE